MTGFIHSSVSVRFVWLFAGFMLMAPGATLVDGASSREHIWNQLIEEASHMGLPTKFLKIVPADFVKFEFDDLRDFAAEYHPEEHRMILNRALSFNAAGGALRPLQRLTPNETETLYHELFHAYMDFLATMRGGEPSDPLLEFARVQQRCRYNEVLITPLVQRRMETEQRFLSEQESWEALNEAWAVFIGWAVWNELEASRVTGRSVRKPGKGQEAWLRRLQDADQEGKLRGYYEPEDPQERTITRKRFLAPASRLSSVEAERLLQDVLDYPPDLVQRASRILASARHADNQCQ